MSKINLKSDIFISSSDKVHNRKYDYSNVSYINSHTNVTIVCPIHGKFQQTPNNHLKGSGCPKCNNNNEIKKMSLADFITRSNEKHKDKYDYTKTIYVNSKTKVVITCPTHGDFFKSPEKHLAGQGCQKCTKEELSKKFCSTTSDFIQKAEQVHGVKYGYFKVNYINNSVYVTITCHKHGDFEQTPANHLQGNGCPSCWKDRRRNVKTYPFEKFLELSKIKHGDKYNYLLNEYKNTSTMLNITCKKHGVFKQRAGGHLQGRGCPKCGIEASKLERTDTKEEFVAKARLVHGNKYDYNKVIYVNRHKNTTITCPIHGDFEQTPGNHLAGKGCTECGIDIRAKKKILGLKKFIEKSNKIHKGKYNYSKTVYINNSTKVIITCPIHGDFEQLPAVHLTGCGCSVCSGVVRYDLESFIEKCTYVHGSKYNYSKVAYSNHGSKVIIVCHKHGDFEQTPGSHLSGSGCPKCKSSLGEQFIMRILEENDIPYIHEYLIPGSTTRHRYDFYLPQHNLLIEFHGIQHYKPIDFFGGVEGLKSNKERDLFKRDLAKLAGIPMIVFNYKELKEDKDKFVQRLLKNIIYRQENNMVT